MLYDLLTVLGPTAAGKTRLAAHVAQALGGEVISGDSRQVYRQMDIGTGKDYLDYVVEGKKVPYHLIDICEAGERYNIYRFQKDFFQVYQSLRKTQKMPVLCGGSGLYIEAVLGENYHLSEIAENKPLRKKLQGKTLSELQKQTEEYQNLPKHTCVKTVRRALRAIEVAEHLKENPTTPQPMSTPVKSLLVGIFMEREVRRKRISQRLHTRLNKGLIEEVAMLLKQGVDKEQLIRYGLEYKFVTLYLMKQLPYDEMVKSLECAIHQFAKRQMTWFRKMERSGYCIHWIKESLPLSEKVDRVLALLRTNEHG